jgi:hypothetical protein
LGDLEIVEVSNVEHHLTMCEPDTAVARFAGLDAVVLEGIRMRTENGKSSTPSKARR